MTRPRIVATADAPTEALVVPAWQVGDAVEIDIEAALEEAAGHWVATTGFKAALSEITLMPDAEGTQTIVIVGLGPKDRVSSAQIRRAAGAAARRLSRFGAVTSRLHRAIEADGAVRAAVEGFLLGSYRFARYKSSAETPKLETIVVEGADETKINAGRIVAEAVLLARDLVNEPPSVLTPMALAQRARAVAEHAGLECEVTEGAEVAERGFGGIATVGQGSPNSPVLIRLRYAGGGRGRKIALVGKGITFDSGGLSLKDAKNMETMKTDMSGAAAVIAAISAAAALELPVDVTAYVPAAENMPSGTSVKPGDVITHYGGKTTEVLNTDAEGRLVLGDAIALACEEGAEVVVDVATLTGSIMVALGKDISGLFTNDDALKDQLLAAAGDAGEQMWPMPLHRPYKKELESEIADQKNVGSRYGGSITAALFLDEFVKEGVAWAHLDIAGIARSESDSDHLSKGGTGLATPTLVRWLEDHGG